MSVNKNIGLYETKCHVLIFYLIHGIFMYCDKFNLIQLSAGWSTYAKCDFIYLMFFNWKNFINRSTLDRIDTHTHNHTQSHSHSENFVCWLSVILYKTKRVMSIKKRTRITFAVEIFEVFSSELIFIRVPLCPSHKNFWGPVLLPMFTPPICVRPVTAHLIKITAILL